MRVINPPAFTDAERLTAAQLNSIHFGGIHTTLEPKKPAEADASAASKSATIGLHG